ncbi:MAG: riboflavin biosynthesis protein RibF [Bacteroidetes bacterium]|nr:MAG: riboflavin biosynthesis protein RibF [Bacteroidota bacterium]
MKVYHSLADYEIGRRTVATIGTFDGLHIGHRTILQRLKTAAAEVGGESLLISFHPHPRLVLFPENNPLRLLHTQPEKIAMLREIGLDKVLFIPFTREFSRLPSRAFIQDILVQGVGLHRIVIGYDHRFGKNRTGGIEELRAYAAEGGYQVEEIPAQSIDDAKVSSTKIRKALLAGEVATAHRYLGYAYGFSGTVVHGEKKGRQLGYPTANLLPEDPLKLIPGNGIYFVEAFLGEEKLYGMMSIGHKPTVGTFDRGYEVHLFDFNRDIYGQPLRVQFLEYIRGEVKFDSLEDLMEAMAGDEAFCRARMG